MALTVVQSFGLPLQGHSGREGFDAALAAAGTLWAVQRNLDVTQLSGAEGAAMNQLGVMDNTSSNT